MTLLPETEEPGWLRIPEALRYLGLDPDDPASEAELGRIVLEYDIDVELSDVGRIIGVEPTGLAKPLFDRHQKVVGYHPEDPKMRQKVMAEQEKEREARKVKRQQRKGLLRTRLEMRDG
jgi:hypothetical protein